MSWFINTLWGQKRVQQNKHRKEDVDNKKMKHMKNRKRNKRTKKISFSRGGPRPQKCNF